MSVDPDPRTYTDVLRMYCLKKNTISAQVGDKMFETVVEKQEETFYAKDQGMIQSTITACEYTRVDGVETSEGGCTQTLDKIWAFVSE